MIVITKILNKTFVNCVNCKEEIKIGYKLLINHNEFCLCKSCKENMGKMLTIDDRFDHIVTSKKQVY